MFAGANKRFSRRQPKPLFQVSLGTAQGLFILFFYFIKICPAHSPLQIEAK
jgi:hypothetical protein